MILLDTHMWYWWVNDPKHLTATQLRHLQDNEPHGLGVSIISCWEMAKLASLGRIQVTPDIMVWLRRALAYPGIQLINLTAEIIVDSCYLPGSFHRDPADQMMVATARVLGIPLLTADARILGYPFVGLLV